MRPALRVAAAFCHHQALGDQPADLRAQLATLTGQSFRRIGRYIELALLGALQCAHRNGGVAADTALYVTSDTPMLNDCVKTLRSVVAEKRVPTPFEFMNISGNMAGFYIAQQLETAGPQLALHRRGAAVESALELLALQSAAHRHCLVGYVAEGLWPLAEQRARLGLAADAELHESSLWLYFDADAAQPQALIGEPLRYATRAEAARALQAFGDTPVQLGGLIDEEDVHVLSAGTAVDRSSGSLAAAVIEFIESRSMQRLIHISRAADGGYYLVELSSDPADRPSR